MLCSLGDFSVTGPGWLPGESIYHAGRVRLTDRDRAGVSEPQATAIVRAVVDALFAATEGGLMAEVSDYLPPDVREYVTPAPSPRDQDEPGQVAYGQAAYGRTSQTGRFGGRPAG